MKYRQGNINDLEQLKKLALKAWGAFQNDLTEENWNKLFDSLNSNKTFTELLTQSYCVVCANNNDKVIGMAFLVPKGNPTEIYKKEWCYIRFVSVDPDYAGQGIGKELTKQCIEYAKKNNETVIALHTSEIMKKAMHIYENFGFKVYSDIEPRLGKKYWLYTLDLNSSI